MRPAVLLVLLAACGGDDAPAEECDPAGDLCERLSSYGLFEDITAQTPADGVVPFDLNTPLFSDYTTKYRFVTVPDGEAIAWDDEASFEMPVGTILVKTFAYVADRREPDGPRDLLETRLLIRTADGWDAAAYVYDDDDADATLAVAGATIHAEWIHDDGEARENEYTVPNKNQCKNCHEEVEDELGPLGPKARRLNRDGQLEDLIELGMLDGAPDPADWPRDPVFDDADTGTLDERARAWMDVNCSHCHSPTGAARTSGLDLRAANTDPYAWGVCKQPVAAGSGSGGLPYVIVPGDPAQSILAFRLDATEADIKMPEIGRNLIHDEGLALIEEWIAAMTPTGCK